MLQIEQLLLATPDGLRRSEIAARMNVARSTITRDVQALSVDAPLREKGGKLVLDKRGYLSEVRLTLYEMEALYISARLFARTMRFPFPHAPSALRKLAEAQAAISPILASRLRSTASDIDALAERFSGDLSGYRKTIELLGEAISDCRPVSVLYYSQSSGTEKQYRVVPVGLEPHFEGRSIYLLSWMPAAAEDGTDPDFRTFNVERIRGLDLEAPDPDTVNRLPLEALSNRLSQAWSIWTSDSPVRVVLKFSASVAARVRETIWHPSQVLSDQPDGSLLWTGTIAEPKEMYPWIRGWGPDVEVLEPATLRETHREDFRRGMGVYGD